MYNDHRAMKLFQILYGIVIALFALYNFFTSTFGNHEPCEIYDR